MIYFYTTFFIFNCFLSTLVGYELAIVSMFRNEGPYIKEWVKYHKMVGVDHFWLYDNGSTDDWRSELQPYIDSGLVEVFDWPSPFEWDTSSHEPIQYAAFKDGLIRAKEVATWVALIDLDEFLVPMKENSVIDCLNKHFSHADAIYVNWRNFGTSNVWIPLGDPILFQLTSSSSKAHPRNGIGKSIVRPSAVNENNICYPHHFPLHLGKNYVNGIGNILGWDNGQITLDGKHYDRFLRINHYCLRDENYYQNVRLKRKNFGYGGNRLTGGRDLLIEHHASFSMFPDRQILKVIKKHYPNLTEEQWKNLP